MKRLRVVGSLCCVVACSLVWAAAAWGAENAPRWTVTSVSRPTNFAPGSTTAAYKVTVTNTGSAPSDGTPVAITDELPEGLTLDATGPSGGDQLTGKALECSFRTCTYNAAVPVDDTLVLTYPVDVSPGATGSLTNTIRVSGGGAPSAFMPTPTTISSQPAGFGVSPGGATTALSSTQAGAHPDLTTSIAFNTVDTKGSLAGNPKDTIDDLPPGFAGDLVDTPTCPTFRFALEECNVATQIGVSTITLQGALNKTYTVPVYNIEPNAGEVAKLGFVVIGAFLIEGGVSVRPGSYGLRTIFANTNEVATEIDNVSLTIWGVPASPIHDPLRWTGGALGKFGASSSAPPAPFFTNPTSCSSEPLQAGFTVNSWEQPQQQVTTPMPFGPIVGCDRLTIEPTVEIQPTSSAAYSPTGLNAAIQIPQTNQNPDGLATSHLDKATVKLPQGMTINPSAGSGLGACTEAQFKYETQASDPAPGQGCPESAKIGSVKGTSPDIKEEATGSIYVAQPYANPFKSLLALYVVARIPSRGVVVASAGEVSLDPVTGQLTTTFRELPQLPISSFTISFRQGQTSPLVTPPECGAFAANAELTPWSVPDQEHLFAPTFQIVSGVDGGQCPSGGEPPFDPQAISGTQSNNAGSYTPFYLRILRQDGEQELTRFSTVLPPGLTGNLTGIPFCPDAAIQHAREATGQQEIHEPSCPTASEIGHTLVGAGVGSVLAWTPGKIYLAGPYHGSALSIVSVTSATVGPFDLGTVVIRFALRINPVTGQAEIDGSTSDPIPHIIDGIVVHVRDIHAYIDRPRFMLNPTSCDPKTISNAITGAGADIASSADDQTVAVNTPFQAADCANLAFKPSFRASTMANVSRRNGAGLTVKLAYPSGSLGTEANIRSVRVELPKQLPSRLPTLQKACPNAVFNADPASCPAASRVGVAKAVTPLIPVPLTGPAYFVSYGGAQFPELVLVLQGYGITIDLHGETFIDERTNVTSSTFKAVPDQPVSSFELTLPQGPYSALAAPSGVCGVPLTMPTTFTAQNGMSFHQQTPISVSGCKPALRVLRHGVKGGVATLTVRVPAAGKLRASGAGLTSAVKSVRKAGKTTVSVALSAGERRFLAKHPGRKLRARIHLRFVPAHGKALSATATVVIG